MIPLRGHLAGLNWPVAGFSTLLAGNINYYSPVVSWLSPCHGVFSTRTVNDALSLPVNLIK
jgi:hypothetical protein